MATISSHNPFRANPLSPNATGTSINPPPSFHSVAGEDETTLNPLDIVPELPPIAEDEDQERDLPPLPLPPASPIFTLDPPPIQEEGPPAYTARPDVTHGESTIQVGPRRPFQQPQATTGRPTPAPGLSPSFTGPGPASSYYLPPTPTGSSLPRPRRQRQGLFNLLVDALAPPFEQLSTSAGIGNLIAPNNAQSSRYQGPRQTRSFSSFTSNPLGPTSPPPLPPRLNLSTSQLSPPDPGRTRSPSTASTASARSGFARDFYATGEVEGLLNLGSEPSRPVPDVGSPPPSWSTPPGAQARRRNSLDANQFMTSPPNRPPPSPNRETGSNSTTTTTRSDFAQDFYAVGEADELLNLGSAGEVRNGGSPRPPARRRSSSDTPIPTSSTAPPSGLTVDNDNRPTTKPTPGHPLLRDGKILVYPKGHTCSKCFNVGYKRADPRHPCKKCWNKYSKTYTPTLLYAPDANAVTTLQRPLPLPNPPQGAPPPLPPSSTRPPVGLAPPQTIPPPSGRGPGAGSQRNRLRSHRHSLSETSSPVLGDSGFRPMGSPAPGNMATVMNAPPPGALVYPAGDPRLGGSRCWRCGGSGRVSLFILDSLQCDECGGIGRLYRGYWLEGR